MQNHQLRIQPPQILTIALAVLSILTSDLQAEVSTSELPILTGTEVVSLHSDSVEDDFVLYIRVPTEAAADPKRKFPVIYAMDGDHVYPMMSSAATQLSWSGAVPPVIIVGVGYGTLDLENGNHRSRDLSPQPFDGRPESGGAPQYHEFLTKDVFAYIEANYPADPETRYLFGHSLGGLFALYTYTKSPEYFKGIIAGSPFLAGQLDLLSEVAGDTEPRSCQLFIATGDQEDPAFFIDDLEPLRHKLEDGWAEPNSFEMVLLSGFDHFTMVAPAISMGLKAVFTQPAKR